MCFGVPRFWASLRHSSNLSESTRPKPHTGSAEGKTQPQRCWQMPKQRFPKTSTLPFDITDWSSWLGRREFGKALQTSTPCRLRCAAPWPGSVVSSGRGAAQRTLRLPLCSRSCAWAGARSQRGTSRPTTAPRSTSWRLRPKQWASGWTRHSFCGLTALHTGISPRALFWEATIPLQVSGKLEGWSLWHRNVLVKLVSRGIWTQERLARLRGKDDGSCELCNDGPGTMFHRCYECAASQTERDMYVSQEVRAAARAVGSSLHTAFFLTLAPVFQQVFLNVPGFVAHSAPRRAAGGAHFHGRLFVGQRRVATGWLGCGGGRHFARAVRQRWRRLRSSHGRAVHLGSAHAVHRLRRYHRDNQRSKAQSPGSPRPPSTRLEQASVFHDEVRAVQGCSQTNAILAGLEHVRRPPSTRQLHWWRSWIVRGGVGSHSDGSNHTQQATGGPARGGACTLGKSRRVRRQRKPRDAAVRPAAVEVVGGVWAQRSVGVKAGSVRSHKTLWGSAIFLRPALWCGEQRRPDWTHSEKNETCLLDITQGDQAGGMETTTKFQRKHGKNSVWASVKK